MDRATYLNKVELQNGYLALGHTNLFIPSTLGGPMFDPDTGEVDKDRLRNNMELATSVYIDRVNHSPCGDTVIQLYRGADSSSIQKEREHLMLFLKGSIKNKEKLEEKEPALFRYFKTVWEIKKWHEILSLPQQYLFGLMCCFSKDCPHPVCQLGKDRTPSKWYPEGPKLDFIPLPIADSKYPWGNKSCTKCKEFCAGHYLSSSEVLTSTLTPMSQPPSCMLKEFHHSLCGRKPSKIMLENAAKNACFL